MKSALIAGSTGLTGQALLRILIDNPDYSRITILVRHELPMQDPRLTQILIDFDRLENAEEIFADVDTVFCCLGTTMKKARSKAAFRKVDYEYPLKLASISAKRGVKRFLCITAMGADPGSSIYYNRVKGEVEKEISKLPIPSITFFRPSLLLGSREEKRGGEKIAMLLFKLLSFIFTGPLKNYKGIDVKKVAMAMYTAAKENTKGVRIVMSGEMQNSIPEK